MMEIVGQNAQDRKTEHRDEGHRLSPAFGQKRPAFGPRVHGRGEYHSSPPFCAVFGRTVPLQRSTLLNYRL
jgi:hypothetical protein